MSRVALYVLPVVTVAFVAFSLLVLGGERRVVGVRFYGGPTEGATLLSWRVLGTERKDGVETPAPINPIRVEARLADGRTSSWEGSLDAEGLGEARLELKDAPVTGPVWVRVTASTEPQPLAEGRIALGPQAWADNHQEIGGWIRGKQDGALTVRVAPGRGVLAVPFTEPLVIDVRSGEEPVAEARLTFEPEGLDVASARGPTPVRTSATGRAVVEVTPREHVCAVRVTAVSDDGRKGEFYARLPVLQGALHATVHDDQLRVASPAPRPRAYYAIVRTWERLAGGALDLDPDLHGGAVQQVPLPPLPPGELWVVVSGEADLRSPSAVGWPLVRDEAFGVRYGSLLQSGPRSAVSVPELLLLDGLKQKVAGDRERRRRALWLCAGFVAAALALLALLMVRRVHDSQVRLEEHLARSGEGAEGVERIAPARRSMVWTLLVALLCVSLAFGLLAALLLYRAY